MDWDLITDIILYTSFAILGVFAFVGLRQWIKRKSLKKVDRELLAVFPSLILMSVTYFIFDKIFILNTRPDGSGKPSFPSSHVMAAATIFAIIALMMPKYVKSKSARIIFDVIMIILLVLLSVGRVATGKHWLSDVIAGLIFAAIYVVIYYLIIRRKHHA